MSIEQEAVDAAYQGVEEAKDKGQYVDLDSTRDISRHTTTQDYRYGKSEGFGGYIEGEGRP